MSQQFAERRARRYRAAETESAEPVRLSGYDGEAAESAPPQDSAADISWFDMESAPHHTAVLLRDPEGRAVEARWREPRVFDGQRWTPRPGWFFNYAGAPRVDFEPDAWAAVAL